MSEQPTAVPQTAFMPDPDDFPSVVFVDTSLRRQLLYNWIASWPTEPAPAGRLLQGDDVALVASLRGPHSSDDSVYWFGEALVHLVAKGTRVSLQVALPRFDPAASQAVLDRVLRAYPRMEASEPNQIQVVFKFFSPSRGPVSYTRMMDVPAWADVRGNYSARVQATMDGLLAPSYRPRKGGQLYLFHGPPGTGKTYVIRTIGSEWRRWCSLEYIVDPEAFFGDASYMMQVLLDSDDAEIPPVADEDGEADRQRGKKWRLLLLEDAGELMAADARARTGQGLSRLLNVTEGLIGQGLRIMILITTNEELSDLHAAVQRPGRAAVQLEFDRLSAEEATAWLQAHGSEERAAGPKTLAEVYDMIAKERAVKNVAHRRGELGLRR